MAKFSLALVMVVSALAPLYPTLSETFGVAMPRILAGSVFLPAMALGAWVWSRTHCFAREWPVVACILIAWVGLLHAGNLADHGGLRFAVYLTIALPCAAMIVENRWWWYCAKTFTLASVVTLGLLVYFEYEARNGVLQWSTFRLGLLRSEDGLDRMTDPNRLGMQFAFASVLAFILHLRGEATERAGSTTARSVKFSLAWTVPLSLGCIATASRGAFAAWFVGIGMLLVWGTRKLPTSKCKGLLAAFCMLLWVTMFVWASADVTPWAKLQERLGGSERAGLGEFGGRTNIWKNAIRVWWSNPEYRLIGTGTGRQRLILGQFDESARTDDRGVLVRSCHSVYVDWLLAHGFVGLIPGLCLLAAMMRRARSLDIQDGTVNRQAFLACMLVASATLDVWGQSGWIACGSLVLAMLSAPRATGNGPHTLAASAGSNRPISNGRYDDTVRSRRPLQRVGSWDTSGKLRDKR